MEDFYLKQIHSPQDLKKLNEEQLEALAKEIREELIETVSKTGGHLASNLGVVELTIALHKVFRSPEDKIVWDVGHQTYVHKLLTGRYDRFSSLRTENGISGFSRPSESEHDMFYSGHSSTSVSAALGIAEGNKLKGNKNYAIAVIGDGAFTGGMVYEALNNAGRSDTRLIVILNNNEMSISKNVGAVAKYLAVIRSKPSYFRLKERTESFLNRIPLIGKKCAKAIFNLKTFVKNLIYSSTMFEQFGFRYMGPIDGHNIPQLCDALEGAKEAKCPVLLHIHTTKGKGYDFAEKAPAAFHGVSEFDINTGEPIFSGDNFSKEFGTFLVDMASKDRRICAITAAMSLGTGLVAFQKKYPDRFFDVGIAEEHAVTFCSGLAKAGMIPVFAVYSSFLQRAYDQIVHDGALQGQKIILAIDRAGFVGEDGETHQGILDVPFINTIPNVTIYSPSTYSELRADFVQAFYHSDGLVAVRYPRGAEKQLPNDFHFSVEPFDLYGDESCQIAVLAYGKEFAFACEAKEKLQQQGIQIKIIKINRIKPIDSKIYDYLLPCRVVAFFEESERNGSVGEIVGAYLCRLGFGGKYRHIAVDNQFVCHASVSSQLHKYHLDTDGIVEEIHSVLDEENEKT